MFPAGSTADGPKSPMVKTFFQEVLSVLYGAALAGVVLQPWLYAPLTYERKVPGQRIMMGMIPVFVRDPDLDNPLEPETVPMWTLLIIMACGGLVMLATEAASSMESGSGAGPAVRAVATWLQATALTEGATNAAKTYMGVMRPNFYAGCEWSDRDMACLAEPAIIHDFCKSFPSGHSAHAACFATLLALHLLRHATLQALRGTAPLRTRALQLAALVPPPLALFIAASRVHDNWHHPADIIAGLCLGAACAGLIYQMMWPVPVIVERDSGDSSA